MPRTFDEPSDFWGVEDGSVNTAAFMGSNRYEKCRTTIPVLINRELEQQDVCRDDACNIISWTAGQR